MSILARYSSKGLKWLGPVILLCGITAAQDKGGTLTVGLSYDLDTLDPYATGFLTDVSSTFLEPLIAPDENARYVPAMATEVPTQANKGIRITDGGKNPVLHSGYTSLWVGGVVFGRGWFDAAL